METGIVGIVNPNYSLPCEQEERKRQANADAPKTKDASTMTPVLPEPPPQENLEDGQFELYQTCSSSGREFKLGKLLRRIRSSTSSPNASQPVSVKAEVSDSLLKKPSAVYSATASLMGKLTAWMDRRGSTTSTAAKEKESAQGRRNREADTQTEGGEELGAPFEDVPL